MESVLSQEIYTSFADENIGPSEIEVNLFVRDFQYIDIVKMEIGVQITFRFTIIMKSHCHRFLFLTVNSQHIHTIGPKMGCSGRLQFGRVNLGVFSMSRFAPPAFTSYWILLFKCVYLLGWDRGGLPCFGVNTFWGNS